MTIRFITDFPAAYVPEIKTLVIAELHLGLEYELYKSGIYIESQRKKFLNTIEKLVKMTKAKKIVLLGDVKHKVPGSSIREDRETPIFLQELSKSLKVILVKGNHDDRLEQIIPEGIKITSSRGITIGKYGFFHGHAWPSKKLFSCDYLLMGHTHPALEFVDKFGFRSIEQVWVRGNLDSEKIKKKFDLKKVGKLNLVILPIFNKMLGGVPINKIKRQELIGPILSNDFIDLKKSNIYLLDGTFLGNLNSIK
ncbi:MAG: metallophosphoesterase [Candidatus Aenigmatarchaeota archaeon]